MKETDGLAGLAKKIAVRLAVKPEIFIIHPAELRVGDHDQPWYEQG